ncbi:hypothetical protein T8S45_00510 [Blastomonas marina]|uniref:Rossmann fold domain-containing protein n=1 Tax=Blastomonas marina TaxID=1867408 RepID=UPI002AC9B841|nr:hypothetical protein [Blastomonas marina]WPZ04047.1 hypothetical protein T8S45_00510 [Blastomonas marina]
MKTLRIPALSDEPLDAAACFQESWLSQARSCDDDLLLVFSPADHSHRNWRLAAVQELAREAAPRRRVNAVASNNDAAIGEAEDYFAEAPGVTGQYLRLAR